MIANSPDVSPTVLSGLSAAKTSVTNVLSATFKNHAHHDLCRTHVDYWESKFETLNVRKNFLDIVILEQAVLYGRDCCILYSLPEKQLSFLLHAGCDTLPASMNLARWNIITSPTTNHILTGCPVALDQGMCT